MEYELNWDKLKDAVHYVAAKGATRPSFGMIKLYKTLWFADARSFVLTGKPITGETYLRQKHGPVPKHSSKVFEELKQEGRVTLWKQSFQDYAQWRFKVLRSLATNRLNHEEIQNLNYWIKHIDEDHTASSISEESHDYGWEIARMGEVLPLHAFLAERIREPREEELEWAKRRAGELRLH